MSLLRLEGCASEPAGNVTASSVNTSVTAGTSPSKGNYATLIASTTRRATGILLSYRNNSTARHSLDIAFGASNTIVVADIHFGSDPTNLSTQYVYLPVIIPVGVSVQARSASSSTSAVSIVGCQLIHGLPGLYRATTYGYDSTNVRGQIITGSGSTNAESGYTQITASTTNPIKVGYIVLTPGTVATAHNALVDIAVGAGGAEVNIITDVYVRHSGSASVASVPLIGPFPLNLPAGVRLSARMQSSVGSVELGVAFIGFD